MIRIALNLLSKFTPTIAAQQHLVLLYSGRNAHTRSHVQRLILGLVVSVHASCHYCAEWSG